MVTEDSSSAVNVVKEFCRWEGAGEKEGRSTDTHRQTQGYTQQDLGSASWTVTAFTISQASS